MNRVEFMRQLESLLQNVAATEREEAIQYYNDYFDDAGSENEQAVIEALGNPARVAENIKRDLIGNGYGETQSRRAEASDRALMKYGEKSADNGEDMEAGTNANAREGMGQNTAAGIGEGRRADAGAGTIDGVGLNTAAGIGEDRKLGTNNTEGMGQDTASVFGEGRKPDVSAGTIEDKGAYRNGGAGGTSNFSS